MSEQNTAASVPETEKVTVIFKRAARWQLLSTLLIASVAGWFTGLAGTVSAIIGGGTVLAGGFVAVCIARRSAGSRRAGAILANMLVAEAAKILVIVLLLWLSFRIYADNIVLMALFSALAAAAILSGTAVYALNSKR